MGTLKLFDTSAELIARRNVEMIPGAISILTAIEYPPAIPRVTRIVYPTKRDSATAIQWQIMLRKKGTPLPAVDLLIAAIAFNNDMILVALDKHFKILKEIEFSV